MTEIIAALLGAFVTWWIQHAATAKERRAKELAEGELVAIRRRGNAPYFVPSSTSFNHLFVSNPRNEIGLWRAGPDLLCFMRDEVGRDLKAGSPVGLVVDNVGQTARALRFELDGKEIEFGREAEMDRAQGFTICVIPTRPNYTARPKFLRSVLKRLMGFRTPILTR